MTTVICNYGGLGGRRCLARRDNGTCTLETLEIGEQDGTFHASCQQIELEPGDETPIHLPGESHEDAMKRVVGAG